MLKHIKDETGITNLGPIPEGMGIYSATIAMRDKRKFTIDPSNHSFRITICETLREIYREMDRGKPDKEKVKELVASAYDLSKRMDRRMKELKMMVDDGESFE
jgi:hypothetical protein